MDDLEMPNAGWPPLMARIAGETFRLTDGNLRNAINDRAVASFSVDIDHLGPIDFSGPLSIFDSDAPRFAGHAVEVSPNPGGGTLVQAESGRELVESLTGHIRTVDVPAAENFHLLTHLSGLPEDRISVEGLDELQPEVVLVEMPVGGVDVSDPFTLQGVEFRPWSEGEVLAGALDRGRTRDRPTCIARTYVTAKLMLHAEAIAIPKIEAAVDALLVTAVYALSRDPQGRNLTFQRDRLLARPALLPIVCSQGVATRRRWVHELRGHTSSPPLGFEHHFRQWSGILDTEPPTSVVNGMRALRDAADPTRPLVDRCHHLWTALEYYAANATPPKLISRGTMKKVRFALKEMELEDAELKRLSGLLDGANHPPLMAKLRHQAAADGVPTSREEWDLLSRLRTVRNRNVHGASADGLNDDDMRWALSVGARFLLFSWTKSQDRRSG